MLELAIITMAMRSPMLQLSQSRLRSRSALGCAWRSLFACLMESANICPAPIRSAGDSVARVLNEWLQAGSAFARHERLVEINHAVGLGKAECRMHLLAFDIFEQHVGGEFAAAVMRGPRFGRGDERARDALPTRLWHDIETFEKSDRRGRATIHIVVPERDFGEARDCAVRASYQEADGAL